MHAIVLDCNSFVGSFALVDAAKIDTLVKKAEVYATAGSADLQNLIAIGKEIPAFVQECVTVVLAGWKAILGTATALKYTLESDMHAMPQDPDWVSDELSKAQGSKTELGPCEGPPYRQTIKNRHRSVKKSQNLPP